MKTTFAVLATIIGLSFMLGGCNTFHGVGKDVERAGEKIQSGSDKTKEKL